MISDSIDLMVRHERSSSGLVNGDFPCCTSKSTFICLMLRVMVTGSGVFRIEWLRHSQLTISSIYFVKRSCVRKTTVPDLVHNLSRLRLIFAVGPTCDRQGSSASHTFLKLLRELVLTPCKEFPSPSALSTKGRRSDLRACYVPQVVLPVDLEPKVVVCVHHFCGRVISDIPGRKGSTYHEPGYLPDVLGFAVNWHIS